MKTPFTTSMIRPKTMGITIVVAIKIRLNGMIDQYRKRLELITKKDFNYIAVTPINGLKSLPEFKYLIKKSMRDYSKKIKRSRSHTYVQFVSLIEVNSTISKGYNLINGKFPKRKVVDTNLGKVEVLYEPKNSIDELGYHTHIFIEKIDYVNELKQAWIDAFAHNGIGLDWYSTTSNDIKSKNQFINYHTKQLEMLDKTFII